MSYLRQTNAAIFAAIAVSAYICSRPASPARAAVPDGPPVSVLLDSIELPAHFRDYADQVTSPFEITLESYNKLAEAIAGNQDPPRPSSRYSIDGFAAQVQTAATATAAINPDPSLDAAQFAVSLDELASCLTQDESLQKLRAYVAAMDSAVAAAQTNLDYLNKLQQAISQLNADAQTFAHIAAVAASIPSLAWNDYFSSTWWDLDQHLAPAIAAWNSATQKQIQAITNNRNRIETQDSNLKGNLQILQPNWCILGGNWSGQSVVDQFGIRTAAALALTRNGAQAGTFTYNNAAMPTRSINLAGRTNLTMVFPGATLQGSFNPQYTQFTGKLTFPGSPGLISTVQLSGAPK
jgi:hypothetical protein